MIFTMVGTHEQQFDRLVRSVDLLDTDEQRIIQYGYSTYQPVNAETSEFIPFDEVKRYIQEANIVITHSGTGSVMLSLSLGKLPIVAPRYKKYGEHIDDHQLQLVQDLEADGMVVPYYDGDDLNERINEALEKMESVRKIEPAPELVAELNRIIMQQGVS